MKIYCSRQTWNEHTNEHQHFLGSYRNQPKTRKFGHWIETCHKTRFFDYLLFVVCWSLKVIMTCVEISFLKMGGWLVVGWRCLLHWGGFYLRGQHSASYQVISLHIDDCGYKCSIVFRAGLNQPIIFGWRKLYKVVFTETKNLKNLTQC